MRSSLLALALITALGCNEKPKAATAPLSAAAPTPTAAPGVPPGGTCKRMGDRDTCARVDRFATAESKGSRCVSESPGGTFCTHACASVDDCADMKREGFVPTCFGAPQGMCLFDRAP
jgi:hypothetical protein